MARNRVCIWRMPMTAHRGIATEGFERDVNARGTREVGSISYCHDRKQRKSIEAHTFLRLAGANWSGRCRTSRRKFLRDKGRSPQRFVGDWCAALVNLACGFCRFAETTGFEVTSAILRESYLPRCLQPCRRDPRSSHSKMSKQGAPGAITSASEVFACARGRASRVLQARAALDEARGPRMLVLREWKPRGKNGRVPLLAARSRRFCCGVAEKTQRLNVAWPYFTSQSSTRWRMTGRTSSLSLWFRQTQTWCGARFLRSSATFGRPGQIRRRDILFPIESGSFT